MFDAMTQARRNETIARRRRPRARADDSRTTGDVSRLLRSGIGLARAALGSAAGLVRDPRSAGEQWMGNLRNARRVLSDLTAAQNTHPFTRSGNGVGRRLDGTMLSLPRMRRLKNKLGVTLNDLILTSVAGAMGCYHERYRLHLDEVSCMVPMNLRQAHQRRQLGNRVGAFYVSLPVGLKDPMARLERIREQTTRAKSDRQGATYQKIMQAVSLFPSAAFRFATRSLEGRVHLICTNVPGPTAQRYLAGAKIFGVYPFAPIMLGTPLSIALLSYGSSYGVGIDADPAAIPDPERIGLFLLEEIDRIEQRVSRMKDSRAAGSNIVTRRQL
jgi:WS/DGAT/MGAT family acyltransferase